MLKKEFEERTKISVSEAEFNGINALYMACGDDIDKDEFCKLYMTFDGRLDLMHKMEREHQRIKDALYEKELLHKEAMEIISDAADAVLEIQKGLLDYEEESPCRCSRAVEQLDIKAFWLIGRGETIKRKAKMGIEFNKEDLEYISNNLK